MTVAPRPCTCDGILAGSDLPCPVHGEMGKAQWDMFQEAAARGVLWPPEGAELIIEGRVLGEPATAGSKASGIVREKKGGKMVPKMRGGRVQTYTKDDSGEKGKSWRAAIHDVVGELYQAAELVDAPMALELRVVRARKKGHYGSGRNAGVLKESAPAHPATRPDLTKQLRAFEDALAKVVIREDSRIVAIHTEKVWGDAPERAEFRLWRLPETVGAKLPGGNSVILPEQASLVDEEGTDEPEETEGVGAPNGGADPPGFPGLS